MALDFTHPNSSASTSASYVKHSSGGTNIDNLNPVSMAVWWRTDTPSTAAGLIPRIVDKTDPTGGAGWTFQRHDGSVFTGVTLRALRNGSANLEARVTDTISTGVWYYSCVTFATTGVNDVEMFLGTETSLASTMTYDTQSTGGNTPANDAAGAFMVGNRNSGPNGENGLNGDVARVGVWSGRLTQTEFQRLQFAPLSHWAAFGTNVLAVDYIHGASTTQRDAGPGQNDGLLTGSGIALSNGAPHYGPLLVESRDSDPYVVAVPTTVNATAASFTWTVNGAGGLARGITQTVLPAFTWTVNTGTKARAITQTVTPAHVYTVATGTVSSGAQTVNATAASFTWTVPTTGALARGITQTVVPAYVWTPQAGTLARGITQTVLPAFVWTANAGTVSGGQVVSTTVAAGFAYTVQAGTMARAITAVAASFTWAGQSGTIARSITQSIIPGYAYAVQTGSFSIGGPLTGTAQGSISATANTVGTLGTSARVRGATAVAAGPAGTLTAGV